MAYLGSRPDTSFRKLSKQTITGNGGTAYTLDYPVNNSSEIEVFVNNVRQEPDVAYTAKYTTLTMTGNVLSTDSFYVVYQGQSIGTLRIPEKDNSDNYNFDNGTLFIDAANSAVSVGTTNVLTSVAGKTTLSVSGSSGSYVTLGTAGTGLGSIFADTNFGINGSTGSLYIINSAANQPIIFQSGSSYTERMRIDNNGRVGFGVTAPATKISLVSGDTISWGTTNYPYISGDASANTLTFGTQATERMRIDTAGRITLPYQPSFLAVGAGFGSQYFSNRLIGNYVNLTGCHNVGGHFSTGASGGTLRFTAPVAGYYLFTAGALWYGGSNTTPSSVRVRINGTTAASHYRDSASSNINETLSIFVYMAANDYADAYAESTAALFFDNGATAGVYGNSNYNFFSGRLVG